jgi:hypothetical protein
MVTMTRARLLRLAAGLAAGATLGGRSGTALAQSITQATEAEIKAAYLLRSIGFVEWPDAAFPSPEAPLRLGVLDADHIATELASMARGRLLGRRPIVPQRLRGEDSVSGLHALFVGRDSKARLAGLVAGAGGQALLTVAENGDSPVPGSAITFVVVDGKVRFDVTPRVAEQLHVKISSRLLPVARRVLQGS